MQPASDPSRDCTTRNFKVPRRATIVGIDVGEDFLDLAILPGDRKRLSYYRIEMSDMRAPVIDSLAGRIRRTIDIEDIELAGAVALIDSPRSPRDLDCSKRPMIVRTDAPRARSIDEALRRLLRERCGATMRPLSMFPTPLARYFIECASAAGCKPHLRTIAQEMFEGIFTETLKLRRAGATASIAGGTFTRFMLAGFAVFPTLEALGVRTYESYPDLQMRLWSAGRSLPPKRFRGEATRTRSEICAQVASIIETEISAPRTLDEADAAILALTAAAGSLVELHCPPEGRFAVAFPLDNLPNVG